MAIKVNRINKLNEFLFHWSDLIKNHQEWFGNGVEPRKRSVA